MCTLNIKNMPNCRLPLCEYENYISRKLFPLKRVLGMCATERGSTQVWSLAGSTWSPITEPGVTVLSIAGYGPPNKQKVTGRSLPWDTWGGLTRRLQAKVSFFPVLCTAEGASLLRFFQRMAREASPLKGQEIRGSSHDLRLTLQKEPAFLIIILFGGLGKRVQGIGWGACHACNWRQACNWPHDSIPSTTHDIKHLCGSPTPSPL